MPLDRQDSVQLNYKADIKHFQKRIAELESGFVNPVVAAQTRIDPDLYIQNLKDLSIKIDSLSNRIDSESSSLRIPVDPSIDPVASAAVLAIDPGSNGLYISYSTYVNCLQQINAGINNLNVESLINNASNDPDSSSQFLQASIYAGYASYSGTPVSSTDTYSSIINSWGNTDSNIQTIVNFSDNFLMSFPSTSYLQWTFKSQMFAESAQTNSFINLWNSSSSSGNKALNILGGVLQNMEVLNPDPDIAAATDQYLANTNEALNNINNLFDSTWSSELLCCFLNFLVASELKTILAFISLLSMLKSMASIDFRGLLLSFKNVLSNMMRNLIINALLNIIMQIYQRVVQPIENWVNTEINKITQLASLCPIVASFIQTYVVSAVQNAESQFKGMIVELMKSIAMRKIQNQAMLSLAVTCNWINQATQVMNTVSQIMRLAQNASNQTQNIASGIADQAASLIPGKSTYTYPVLGNPNQYNTFPVPLQQSIPNPIGILNCGQSLPSSITPAAPIWTLNTNEGTTG